jgi:hypothetical protein
MKKPIILAMGAVAAALLMTGCASDGYGYGYGGANLVYDGYYDNYYGNIYDGYWGSGNTFYYRNAPGGRYMRDRSGHFRRDMQGREMSNYRPMHGERQNDHRNQRDRRHN